MPTPTPKLFETCDVHDSQVLFSVLSPNGEDLVMGAGDENLKFWHIWDLRDVKGKKKTVGKKEEGGATRGILEI
jgi:cell division cycle protein 20 (cofactor of APC complex)